MTVSGGEDSFNSENFCSAFSQQLGVDRHRLTIESSHDLHNVPPREGNVEVVAVVGSGADPTLAVVEEAVRGIVNRSHSSHRYIAGYRVLTINASPVNKPPVDTSSLLSSLIHRIRSRLFRDRIRLREFMSMHDRLKSRRIPKSKFRTACAMAKLNLTDEDLSLLEEEFEAGRDGQPGGCHEFLYADMCDAVECVLSERDGQLEADPTQQPKKFVPCGMRWDHHNGRMELRALDDSESAMLYTTCKRILDVCRRRRIEIESYLRERDTRRRGTIEKSEFRAVLNLLELRVSQEELAVVFKRFAVPGPEVNYVDFLRHCNSLGDLSMTQSSIGFSAKEMR